MSNETLLHLLRSETPEPSAAELHTAYAKLEHTMARETARGARTMNRSARLRRRATWSVARAGTLVALVFGGGTVALAVDNQVAVERLTTIVDTTVKFADTEAAPGDYLLDSTRANWGVIAGATAETSAEFHNNLQQLDVYMPVDPNSDWMLVRDWGALEAATAAPGSSAHTEQLRARNGNFYTETGDPNPDHAAEHAAGWLGVDLAEIPTASGADAYAWIDAQYTDGSASHAEDNFERISALLRTGLMPAAQRAVLLEALTLVPGVTSTPNVKNLDGTAGIAFGRTEAIRHGERTEIIVDPESGLVIGERTIAGLNIFGFGPSEVMSSTAITTTVVAAAP